MRKPEKYIAIHGRLKRDTNQRMKIICYLKNISVTSAIELQMEKFVADNKHLLTAEIVNQAEGP